MQALQGKIAVVTGASRGCGRGIAAVLGEEGATVYVTGRSTEDAMTRPDLAATSIEETARQVTERGGKGIAVQCDHTNDDDVEALFQRVQDESGRLDILVNNVWGGYERIHTAEISFVAGFWKQPLWRWDRMFDAGVRAHFTASRLAARIMIPQRNGLIVNTTFWDDGKYISNLLYDVAKSAIDRMAFGMAYELEQYGITAVAVSPGWMRTEAVLAACHSAEELEQTESVEYIGRAVAALAGDPALRTKSGKTMRVGDLAKEYGFTDIDGRQVPPFEFCMTREDRDLTP